MRCGHRSPWLRWGLVVSTMVAMAVLGGLWFSDRHRSWDVPVWTEGMFVALRPPTRAAATQESWFVPVNPDCPHCAEHLARTLGRRSARARIHALVVDQVHRPTEDVFGEYAVDAAWWDSAGIWRHRWGHRLYGETMVFDRRGRLLRTDPPGTGVASVAGQGMGVPPDDY